MGAADDLVGAFETHSPEGIRSALREGAGVGLVDSLITMYTRSSRFRECLQVMLDAGASVDGPLAAILLDEPDRLDSALDPEYRFTLPCTFTPLTGASPLHVCAEYNSLRCARALLDAGHDVNVRAGFDAQGFNGHTPLFHTVNSNRNFARPMMELLCQAGADTAIQLKAIVWGRGFDWETTVFDVTPISYAQCGLYSQFHRREEYIYDNISYLYQRRNGVAPVVNNVPNKYLADDEEELFPPRM